VEALRNERPASATMRPRAFTTAPAAGTRPRLRPSRTPAGHPVPASGCGWANFGATESELQRVVEQRAFIPIVEVTVVNSVLQDAAQIRWYGGTPSCTVGSGPRPTIRRAKRRPGSVIHGPGHYATEHSKRSARPAAAAQHASGSAARRRTVGWPIRAWRGQGTSMWRSR
jgi:hypothetical protein